MPAKQCSACTRTRSSTRYAPRRPGTELVEAPAVTDYLYRAIDAGQPGTGGRYALADIDQVVIGRGDRAGATRSGRILRIDCPDPFMSSDHAHLERERAHWVVVDDGSRNGLSVNGVQQTRAIVLDHDVIELGRTLLVLRESQPVADDVDVPRRAAGAAADGLTTLDPELESAFAQLRQVAPSVSSRAFCSARSTEKP